MLIRNWDFVPDTPAFSLQVSRVTRALTGRRRFPQWAPITPVRRAERWNCLFLFTPNGELDDAQRYSIRSVAGLTGRLMVVVAAPSIAMVPEELKGICDALYWKALGGYDFSAYAIALHAVATASPGADLYLQNDSVLGPFGDVDALLASACWRLTGFMACAGPENHLQSYALFLRDVTPDLARMLKSVLGISHAYDRWADVVRLHETRLARIAARAMSVGALWYEPVAVSAVPGLVTTLVRKAKGMPIMAIPTNDPSLVAALDLIEEGFPFLKRSLTGRNAHLQDRAQIAAFLAAHGHPEIAHG